MPVSWTTQFVEQNRSGMGSASMTHRSWSGWPHHVHWDSTSSSHTMRTVRIGMSSAMVRSVVAVILSEYLIHVGPVKEIFQSEVGGTIVTWDEIMNGTLVIDSGKTANVETIGRDANVEDADSDAWVAGGHHTISQYSERPWSM